MTEPTNDRQNSPWVGVTVCAMLCATAVLITWLVVG